MTLDDLIAVRDDPQADEAAALDWAIDEIERLRVRITDLERDLESDRMNTGSSPDFWPSVMDRDRCVATAQEMATAWHIWNGETSSNLAACLRRAGAVNQSDGAWPFHRLADGMLQRARRAGLIEWNGRRWRLL